MQITKKTKWLKLSPLWALLTDKQRDEVMNVAEKELGTMWQLQLIQFFACINGDFKVINLTKETKDEDVTVLQYVWVLRFQEFVTQLTELLEKLVLPETMDSKNASKGLVHLTFEESVYSFCREFFGLHSFNEADTLTMHEYLLARTIQYNKELYQNNMNKIVEKRMKARNVKH